MTDDKHYKVLQIIDDEHQNPLKFEETLSEAYLRGYELVQVVTDMNVMILKRRDG